MVFGIVMAAEAGVFTLLFYFFKQHMDGVKDQLAAQYENIETLKNERQSLARRTELETYRTKTDDKIDSMSQIIKADITALRTNEIKEIHEIIRTHNTEMRDQIAESSLQSRTEFTSALNSVRDSVLALAHQVGNASALVRPHL